MFATYFFYHENCLSGELCLALPCLALPCLALPCLALPCLALSCLTLTCLTLSCLVLSCLVLSCLVLSCLVLSCLVLYCLALSCRGLPCLVLSHLSWSTLPFLVLSYQTLSLRSDLIFKTQSIKNLTSSSMMTDFTSLLLYSPFLLHFLPLLSLLLLLLLLLYSNIVEQCRLIVADNGYADVVEVIRGKMEDIILPVDYVDIIISEWMVSYIWSNERGWSCYMLCDVMPHYVS